MIQPPGTYVDPRSLEVTQPAFERGSLKTNHPHPKGGMVGWSPRISYSIQLVGWKMPQIQQGTLTIDRQNPRSNI